MEDPDIIRLFLARNEEAIKQTEIAYGKQLLRVAENIIYNVEDAKECVSDTYLATWDSIPPQQPVYFFCYIAKICRRIAFRKLDWNNAQKRKATVVELSAEMEMCIPDHNSEISTEEVGAILSRFLRTLSTEARLIFLRRYWYGDSIKDISTCFHISESKVKTNLHRTRGKLRTILESEGVNV